MTVALSCFSPLFSLLFLGGGGEGGGLGAGAGGGVVLRLVRTLNAVLMHAIE